MSTEKLYSCCYCDIGKSESIKYTKKQYFVHTKSSYHKRAHNLNAQKNSSPEIIQSRYDKLTNQQKKRLPKIYKKAFQEFELVKSMDLLDEDGLIK